ncbi:hypothetical protein CLV44_11949 [Marinobacterium halophilum]|uniref:Cobalamin ABC transporter n=1 Tax=Marinobacterium halophilum TaxID=267374 RepID=A0A2P8ES07_9GAMM|nr:hypothetical protein [Marinobacterium halophilum]PSL12215.1 hypothetical protein CLV44_11949 [Marinobacterium halophilum]
MMKLAQRDQLLVGLGLIILLALTRGQHFASVDHLPSASWAVFFLAGVFLRPLWSFPLLFLEAVLLDVSYYGWSGAAAHCITPAYALLVPAYASLWYAGRVYAGLHRDHLSTLGPLLLTLLAGAFVCNLFSSGGYYFFSGNFEATSLAGLWGRIEQFLPSKLVPLLGYTGLAAMLYTLSRQFKTYQELNRT